MEEKVWWARRERILKGKDSQNSPYNRQIFIKVRLPARSFLFLSLSPSYALIFTLILCRTYTVVGLKVSFCQAKVKSLVGRGQPFIRACPRRTGKGSGWKLLSAPLGR